LNHAPGPIIRDSLKASDLPLAFATTGKPESGELAITRHGRRVQMDFNLNEMSRQRL